MEDVSLAEVLEGHGENLKDEIHSSCLGKIVSYDPNSQTCSVQPMCKRVFYDPDTLEKLYESYPTIPMVPVMFPGGSGFTITWPLAQGDTVDLVINDAALGDFLASGQESKQQDIRRHDLSHAKAYPVFVPGPRPSTDAATVANENMVIGQAGGVQIQIDPTHGWIILGSGASDFVALASLVKDELDKIATAFSTFVPGSGGASFPHAYSSSGASVAASVTKAK